MAGMAQLREQACGRLAAWSCRCCLPWQRSARSTAAMVLGMGQQRLATRLVTSAVAMPAAGTVGSVVVMVVTAWVVVQGAAGLQQRELGRRASNI